MDELTSLAPGQMVKADNPAESLSDESLLKAIAETSAKIQSGQTEQQQPPQGQVAQTPTAPEVGQVQPQEAVEQPSVPKVEPVQDGTQQKSVEQKADTVTFEKVSAETGLKTPDDLARSYKAAVRKIHELSQPSRVQTPQPPQYQPTPPQSMDINAWVQQGMQTDPAGTIAAIVMAAQKPVMDQQRDIALNSEFMRLSSSPKTADFNLPEIQGEIHKIAGERPELYLERDGSPKPQYLEDMYYQAKGRLGRVQTAQPATPQVNRAMPIEGASKPVQPQAFNPQTSSLEDLAAVIKKLQANL